MAFISEQRFEQPKGETRERQAAENIQAALEQYVNELQAETSTRQLTPEVEKTILQQVRENPRFAKTLRAFLLGISTFASTPATAAESKPQTKIEQAAPSIDAEKSAGNQATRDLAKQCNEECGIGVLNQKTNEWAQEAHINPQSIQWEARTNYGSLGWTVHVTLMDDRVMAERRGAAVRKETVALIRSEEQWRVERVQGMNATFSGDIAEPSAALRELTLQSAKRHGLNGNIIVEIHKGYGGLGEYITLSAKDSQNHSFQERASISRSQDADVAMTNHLARKIGLIPEVATASK